jgi:hypothetical protein
MSDSDDNLGEKGGLGRFTHISLHSLQPWNWDCVAELIFGAFAGLVRTRNDICNGSGLDGRLVAILQLPR